MTFLGITYLLFLVPASLGVLALWVHARKVSQWSNWELQVLVLPYLAWCIPWHLDSFGGKSLLNLLEPALVGIAVIVLALVRIKMWNRGSIRAARVTMAGTLIVFGIALWWIMPASQAT